MPDQGPLDYDEKVHVASARFADRASEHRFESTSGNVAHKIGRGPDSRDEALYFSSAFRSAVSFKTGRAQ